MIDLQLEKPLTNILGYVKSESLFKVIGLTALLFLIGISTSWAQCNCNFTIPASSGYVTFDGPTKGVKAGDVICVNAGTVKNILFTNIRGAAGNPVIIKNCGGQVLLGGATANNGMLFLSSKYVHITGTGDSQYPYGIKIVQTAPGSQGVAYTGLSSDIEIDHLEIANAGFAGILVKTDPSPNCADKSADRPNFTLYNVNIHDNYIHHSSGEGVYVGNSYYMGTTIYCGSMQYPHEVRGVKIHHNKFDSNGWETIQVGASVSGVEIYNNSIYNYGTKNASGQNGGVQLGIGTSARFYNNLIKSGTGPALAIQGIGNEYIYNNVFVSPGVGGAITMNTRPTPLTTDIVSQGYLGGTYIINNTFVNAINGVAKDHVNEAPRNVMYNNLVVSSASTWDNTKFYYDWKKGNNVVVPVLANAKFANAAADDYRLLSGSPAINTGIDVSAWGVTTDASGIARLSSAAIDAGAYEFTGSTLTPPVVNAGADRTITLPTNTLSLTGTASDPDGTITSYAWTKQSGPAAILSGIATSTLSASGLIAGTYIFRLTATDNSALTASDEVTVIVNTTSTTTSSTVVYRINAGSPNTITASPMNWIADSQSAKSIYLDDGSLNYTGGSTSWSGTNTTGAPNEIFGPFRYSPNYTTGTPMQWNFPAASGTYEVSLFFAESPYAGGVSTSGARVFSVKIEGVTVLSNFDIYATAGMNAVKKVFQVTVSDGTLDMDFIRVTGNPQVNGIEVVLKSTGTTASRMADTTETPLEATEQEKLLESSLDVYPNPFQDQINITFGSEQKEVHVTLVSMSGQLVFKQVFTDLSLFTLDMSENNLAPGMYILSVATERGKIYRKVLKE